jgi:hypothetical protein
MKTSTILFLFVCIATLGVQILNDIGLYQSYKDKKLEANGTAPLIALPQGNIKAVVTDSVNFTLHQGSSRKGLELTQRSDDWKQVLDFKVKNDTLYIHRKNKYYPDFELYLSDIECIVANNANVYYQGTTNKLVLDGRKKAELHIVSSYIKNLQLRLSDGSYGELPEKTTIDTLVLSMQHSSSINARNAQIKQMQQNGISEDASLDLQMNGRQLREFLKAKQ